MRLKSKEVIRRIKDVSIDRKGIENQNGVIRVLCSIQMIAMVSVTLHSTAMPFLVRIANKTPFLPTTSVFMMEVLKLLFCVIITIFKSGGIGTAASQLHSSIWKNRVETLKVSVPAVVYAIQNNLYYIALANIDPTTYSVTLQLRILTTAILSVCLLNKKLSYQQWGALVIALSGVILVQLDKASPAQGSAAAGSFLIGVLAVIGMCWTSAFAGVYFEKMLKNSSTDLWVQNIRLSLLTLFFAAFTMFATDAETIFSKGLFQGWSPMVWLVTFLNSVGGLCVSLVMKYADNVMKTYCQSIAIGLTSLVSILLGERLFTAFLFCGVLMVIVSVVVYSLYPPTIASSSSDSSDIEYRKLDQEELITDLEYDGDEDEDSERV